MKTPALVGVFNFETIHFEDGAAPVIFLFDRPTYLVQNPKQMKKGLATILLVAGLFVIGYGLMKKDDGQASIDLGKTEINIGKKDSAFSPYFIVGGILAIAGAALLLTGKKG